jgi:uncharacterized membrane protein
MKPMKMQKVGASRASAVMRIMVRRLVLSIGFWLMILVLRISMLGVVLPAFKKNF